MRTILKVVVSAIVTAVAIGTWFVGVLFVPSLQPLGFALGVLFAVAVCEMMEGLEECDGEKKRKKGRDV